MEDPRTQWVTHLHRRAAHCRRLAEVAASERIAEELIGLAQSYEAEALGIETKGADGASRALTG
jgi:hypothetical protein